MKEFKFKYNDHTLKMDENGTIYELRASAYMPDDKSSWYRCQMHVFSPIAKMFFEMLAKCQPDTQEH